MYILCIYVYAIIKNTITILEIQIISKLILLKHTNEDMLISREIIFAIFFNSNIKMFNSCDAHFPFIFAFEIHFNNRFGQ